VIVAPEAQSRQQSIVIGDSGVDGHFTAKGQAYRG
jgi:hypothetical protein